MTHHDHTHHADQVAPDSMASRLDAALLEAPPPPPIETQLAAGRRALRRRRALAGGAAFAVAAVMAGGAVTVAEITAPPENVVQPASMPALSAQDVAAECAASTEVSPRNRDRLFGSGTAEVLASDSSVVSTRAVLRSADGRFWGECWLSNDEGGEFDSGITVYSTDPARVGGISYGAGPGCPTPAGEDFDPACEQFRFAMTDRRPEVVAKVKAVLADGSIAWATTREGYFAFDVVSDLPAGVQLTDDGLPEDFSPLRTMSFYDADGGLLVEQDFVEVPGTPENPDTLNQYPSLAGNPLR